MQRECASCGDQFEAKRASAKFCGDACKMAAHRARTSHAPAPGVSIAQAAVRSKLERVGVDSEGWLAAAAVTLAARIDETPGSGAATLVRELRATMAELLADVPAEADGLDELKARRDRKRAAG